MKCMSQYLRIMSLKMRWPWIWATFGIQTMCCYLLYSCMHEGTYELLHSKTNALLIQFYSCIHDGTYDLLHSKTNALFIQCYSFMQDDMYDLLDTKQMHCFYNC